MVRRLPSIPLPMYHTVVRRTIPVVDRPDSETHWTCPSGSYEGITHHMKFPQNVCIHCGQGAGVLRDTQRRLQGSFADEAGHRFPLWQVEHWDGKLVYLKDETGSTKRTYVTSEELRRVWTLLNGAVS